MQRQPVKRRRPRVERGSARHDAARDIPRGGPEPSAGRVWSIAPPCMARSARQTGRRVGCRTERARHTRKNIAFEAHIQRTGVRHRRQLPRNRHACRGSSKLLRASATRSPPVLLAGSDLRSAAAPASYCWRRRAEGQLRYRPRRRAGSVLHCGNDVTGPSTTRSSAQPPPHSGQMPAPRTSAPAVQRSFGVRWPGPASRLACALGLASCTLGVEDYQPPLVERETLAEAPDASERSRDAGLECRDAGPRSDAAACLPAASVAPPRPEAARPAADAGACRGADCPSAPPVLVAPSCTDGARNGDEADVDCGGSCEVRCLAAQTCGTSDDCSEGFYCPEVDRVCTAVSCSDGVRNGSELAPDCGGGCPGCPDGAACGAATDCLSGVCGEDATCAPPSCEDGVANQDEPAPDCGGSCDAGCQPGLRCAEPGDCASGVCEASGCSGGAPLCCQAPACDDGVLNGGEASLDCGGGACAPCQNGRSCSEDADCESTLCTFGRCEALPTCDDEQQNGDETAIDCGGDTCGPCPDGQSCIEASDCASNGCEEGVCISCGDGEQNGLETDVDCGGADPSCARCASGGRCASNDDCAGAFCVAATCS